MGFGAPGSTRRQDSRALSSPTEAPHGWRVSSKLANGKREPALPCWTTSRAARGPQAHRGFSTGRPLQQLAWKGLLPGPEGACSLLCPSCPALPSSGSGQTSLDLSPFLELRPRWGDWCLHFPRPTVCWLPTCPRRPVAVSKDTEAPESKRKTPKKGDRTPPPSSDAPPVPSWGQPPGPLKSP